jgi:hypothetical protein
MLVRSLAAALMFALLATGPAGAVTAWNEDPAVDGDLSGNNTDPTDVTFVPGQNDVLGQTGKAGTVADRDYFTFVIPNGYVLDALIVLNSQLPAGNFAFLGLQSGDEVISPIAPDAGLLLGYKHFAPADIGTDILPEIATAAGAQGFTPPLGPGTYSVWIQDTNLGASIYALQFDVALAPGPETALLTLTGLAGLVGMRLVGNRIKRRRAPAHGER